MYMFMYNVRIYSYKWHNIYNINDRIFKKYSVRNIKKYKTTKNKINSDALKLNVLKLSLFMTYADLL